MLVPSFQNLRARHKVEVPDGCADATLSMHAGESIFQPSSFFKGLASFAHREINQAKCTKAVYKAKSCQLIDQAGHQQHH